MAVKSSTEALKPVRTDGKLKIWGDIHLQTAITSLLRLASQPFATFMTVLVIAVTLALPTALHLLIKNARSVSSSWENALDFSVYLDQSIALDEAEILASIIEQRADVESVTLVSSTDALAEFKQHSGFGDALNHLTDNPLPHTLIVRPSVANTQASMSLLNEELSNLPETDIVQIDTAWVQRFHAILEMLQRAIAMGAVLLGAAIIVIIGNTIRLDIQNRREEIEVTKLIGASNGFVRRPFLYSGFWYGLGGGLLALAMVGYGLYALREPVARLAGLYNSGFTALALNIQESAIIVGIGILLGLTGSWLAAARHMRRIEPR